MTSPLSTLPASAVSDALQELQEYVNSVHEIMIPNTTNGESNTETAVDQCLVDDGAILGGEPVHVFRPSKGHGIALHYALVKERGVIQKCASILLNEGGGSASPKVSVEFLSGVLFCVGVSGVSYAHHSSTLISTITRRMRDFIGVLQGLESYSDPSECQTCIKSFLSASLLLDDEERKTNAMADTDAVTLISDMEGDSAPMEKLKSPIGAVRKNAKRGHSKRAALKGDSSDMKLTVTATSSADLARITVEKVAILSVSETESQLRKYEATGLQRRSSMASALGKTKAVRARRRKAGNEADLEGFDCPTLSPPKQKSPLSALQPPGLDTVSQLKPISPRNRPPRLSPTKPALPTLMAPRNDVGSRRTGLQSSRRWSNGESNVSRGPPPLIATRDVSSRGQAAFNAFAVESSVNDSFANGSFPNQQFAGVSDTKVSTNGTANHAAATSDERDPWGMIPAAATTEFNTAPSIVGEEEHQKPIRFEFSGPSDEGESALSPNSMGGRSRTHNDAVSSLQRLILAAERTEMNGLKDDDDTSRGSRHSAMSFQNGEWLQGMDEELRSAHSELDELVARVTPSEDGDGTTDDTEPRLMINLALNEDLTCSYRQSKMSSCSIEGVVQVQVACNRRDGVPFYLLVRDPSRHIRIVQENRRFSDSMAEELRLSDNPDDAGVDHKYTVSVPSADDYFPVLRYKCSSELRPVPIVSTLEFLACLF